MSKTTLGADIIADYFLYKGNKSNTPITNKKLQKLLYYAQAWSLVIRDNKLFKDKIEAWVHGPAIKNIYFKFKSFGFSPIQSNIQEQDIKDLSPDVISFLDEIWNIYGHLDAQYLETLSHSEQPWIEAREGLQSHEGSSNIISLPTMRKFFSEKLKASKRRK